MSLGLCCVALRVPSPSGTLLDLPHAFPIPEALRYCSTPSLPLCPSEVVDRLLCPLVSCYVHNHMVSPTSKDGQQGAEVTSEYFISLFSLWCAWVDCLPLCKFMAPAGAFLVVPPHLPYFCFCPVSLFLLCLSPAPPLPLLPHSSPL